MPKVPKSPLLLAGSKVPKRHRLCRPNGHPLGLNPAGVLLFRMRAHAGPLRAVCGLGPRPKLPTDPSIAFSGFLRCPKCPNLDLCVSTASGLWQLQPIGLKAIVCFFVVLFSSGKKNVPASTTNSMEKYHQFSALWFKTIQSMYLLFLQGYFWTRNKHKYRIW